RSRPSFPTRRSSDLASRGQAVRTWPVVARADAEKWLPGAGGCPVIAYVPVAWGGSLQPAERAGGSRLQRLRHVERLQDAQRVARSEEHTSELQSREN